MPTAEHPFVAHLLDFYRRTAGGYDAWDSGVHSRAATRLVEVAAPAGGDSTVDIGCGTGMVAHAIAALAPAGQTVGIDVSPAMLAIAAARTGTARFLQMDARDLYLQDGAFDLVTLGQVLPYLVQPERVLGEARRVLRPGGRIVVSCQQRSLATPAETLFFHRLDAFARTGFRIPRPPDHNALLGEPWALRTMLERAGFRDVRTTNMVVGNHTADARAWVELMRGAGPYPHALIGVLGGSLRAQLETALDLTMGSVEEGAFRYHRAFTYAVATRP